MNTWANRIEINPEGMLGKPVVRGKRIPVELLLRKLAEGAIAPLAGTRSGLEAAE